MRKVLLLEPKYRNKYPPMGLMKLASYFRDRGDDVRFYKGDLKVLAATLFCEEYLLEAEDAGQAKYETELVNFIMTGSRDAIESVQGLVGSGNEGVLRVYRDRYVKEDFPKFQFVGVTTLFTFYWRETINTINYAKKFLSPRGRMMVGGIASSILPEKIEADTEIKPHVGLLDKPGVIDASSDVIIDALPLDYSILEEVDYEYPTQDAYLAYMTRGCVNRCEFCAVPRLEPDYCSYISLKAQLEKAERRCGARKDLMLLDNNVFASDHFDKIIDEIKECGFGRGATYTPPSSYDIAFDNITAPVKEHRNKRAYIKKMVALYDAIAERLPEDAQGNFYLERERLKLLYPIYATTASVQTFDAVARPLYAKYFKRAPRTRYIDFNQGTDARLVTDEKMAKLAEINIRPLRIAFDHYAMRKVYVDAIRSAAKHGIKDLSNYLLYNFKDEPDELYNRMRINVDLCEELGVTIYSFPMKYHPIDDPDYFDNRDFIGEHWNRKFIRAVQAVLNATKGKIGRGRAFFEEAFGRNLDEFHKILWMPEAFIIYRRRYDAELHARLAERYPEQLPDDSNLANEWWARFQALDPQQLETAKAVIADNRFKDEDFHVDDPAVNAVLEYYKITRVG